MKKNFLLVLKMISLYSFLGVLLQAFLLNMLFANNNTAQSVKSVKEVYVNLDIKNASLEKAFKLIESSTNFVFAYDKEDLDSKVRINIIARNRTLESVLLEISETSALQFRQVNHGIDVKKASTPLEKKNIEIIIQTHQVTGKVTSIENREPLPGVNVVEKGTSRGTVTDVNGNFTLEVSEGAVLVFSSVGLTTEEIAVAGRSVVNVALAPDVKQLQELVVIGYGEVKKRDLIGSVGTVSSDEVVARGTTSVMGAIQGRVSGVDITQASGRAGAGFNIKIRGQNSLNSNIQPLYVVDGIVTDDIDFLNPSDIQRVDILKDASSTAIYGSRGSSGVVLITTKAATTARPGKLNVNYDGYYGIRKTARRPDFQDGRQFAEYRAMAYWMFNQTTKTWSVPNNDMGTVIMSHTQGGGSPVFANRLYEEDYTDFFKLVEQDGAQQNHYLNVSGTGNDLTYHFGVGYQNEDGNFYNEYLDRYNFKLSLNHKPSKFFEVGGTSSIYQTVSNYGAGSVYETINQMAPWFTPFHPDGSPVVQPGADGAETHTNRGVTGTRNPLAQLKSENNETRRIDFLGMAYIKVNPIKGIEISSTISPRYFRDRTGYFKDIIRDTYLTTRVAADPIRTGRSINAERMEYTWDNLINYKTNLGEYHNLTATGGVSVFSSRYEALRIEARNLSYESLWYNLFKGTEVLPNNSSSSYSESSLLSYLARLNYDYRGTYLVTASLRYDGASRLADKWSAFPSFGLAWRASEESFMQAGWLSDLKLRLSYGSSGSNAGVDPYGTLQKPNTDSEIRYNFGSQVLSGFSPGAPVNPNLAWEKTRELNLGIDFGILKARIFGSVNLYDKLSDGLLLDRRLALESGVNMMKDNIGSVNNRGIEVELNTMNVETKNFSWTTGFTFAKNNNKIVSIYNKKEDDIGNRWFIGKPVEVIYDYKYLGVWTMADFNEERTVFSNYTASPGEARVADNGDGILDANDKMVLGTPFPKWTGGVNSSMTFKNFDFAFNIYARQGSYILDRFSETFLNYNLRSTVHLNYDYYIPAGVYVPDWDNFVLDANGYARDITFKLTTEEHVGKYPLYHNRGGRFYNQGGSNLPYYKDNSFVKVKNISLGYTFDKNFLAKAGVTGLRIYMNVLNPFVFTKYEGYDPEYAETRVNGGNGPSNITYQFGMNLKF